MCTSTLRGQCLSCIGPRRICFLSDRPPSFPENYDRPFPRPFSLSAGPSSSLPAVIPFLSSIRRCLSVNSNPLLFALLQSPAPPASASRSLYSFFVPSVISPQNTVIRSPYLTAHFFSTYGLVLRERFLPHPGELFRFRIPNGTPSRIVVQLWQGIALGGLGISSPRVTVLRFFFPPLDLHAGVSLPSVFWSDGDT